MPLEPYPVKTRFFYNLPLCRFSSHMSMFTPLKSNDIFLADRCLYMHSTYPCKRFHFTGSCYRNEKCIFSHAIPPTPQIQKILDRLRKEDWLPDDTKGTTRFFIILFFFFDKNFYYSLLKRFICNF